MKTQLGRKHTLAMLVVLTILAFAFTVQVAGALGWSQPLSGKVTDTKGNPLSDVAVHWYWYNSSTGLWTQGTESKTAADGTYTVYITGTIPNSQNVTLLFDDKRSAFGASYRDQWWKGIDAGTQGLIPLSTQAVSATHFTVTGTEGPLTGYDAALKIYHVKISGKITDRAGTPIAGVYVQPYGRALNTQTVHEFNGMITGADGLYTVWVEPHIQADTWWSIYASPRNSMDYHPRWYNNILAQLGTTMPIVDQAALPTVTRFMLDSDQQAPNIDISLTQNKADKLSVTYAKPKSKGSKTLIAGGYLNPSHDPKITIKAKIYKYNASKKKYVYKYTVTAKQTAKGLSTKWSISKKVTSKGKYKVKVYVSKHLWWAHRATSASRVGTIK